MSEEVIDLRSDTVTRPTPAMLEAMMKAPVGDDVFGDDPSVNLLEEESAAFFGKEAALFVPTGTMANQVALRAQTRPGDEVLVHFKAHIMNSESGAGAALAGIQFRAIGTDQGAILVEQASAAYHDGSDFHDSPTTLICVENTHGSSGGTARPLDELEALTAFARQKGIAMHLDGARMLNACVGLDVKPATMAALFDSNTLCFSKALGAPGGSVVVGNRDFVRQCRRYRKMYGGGMRQVGYFAEAARHALRHHVTRLAEDHDNARLLAKGFAANPHITLLTGIPQTNMFYYGLEHPRMSLEQFREEMGKRGVLLVGNRIVSHLDVSSAKAQRAVEIVNEVLGN